MDVFLVPCKSDASVILYSSVHSRQVTEYKVTEIHGHVYLVTLYIWKKPSDLIFFFSSVPSLNNPSYI